MLFKNVVVCVPNHGVRCVGKLGVVVVCVVSLCMQCGVVLIRLCVVVVWLLTLVSCLVCPWLMSFLVIVVLPYCIQPVIWDVCGAVEVCFKVHGGLGEHSNALVLQRGICIWSCDSRSLIMTDARGCIQLWRL